MKHPSPRTLAIAASQDSRAAQANRRLAVLQEYDRLVASGERTRTAARRVGASPASISRWSRAHAAEGFAGLLPRTADCGRKTAVEKLNLSQDIIDRVKAITLDTESVTAAFHLFARRSDCPPALSEQILAPRASKQSIPPSLRASATPDAALIEAHRGKRRLALKTLSIPRHLDILPGDIFSSDDTTPIWAWWVPWPRSEQYPYGKKLLQGQMLPVIDVASQCCLTIALIARESASYRANDIWALFGAVFTTHGLPRLGFQLERGTWESNLVAGEQVEYQQGDVTLHRRLGGLRMLPSHVLPWHTEHHPEMKDFPKHLQTWTSYLPKSKSIEAFFNRSQTLEGTLWGCLGRDQMRRPFEQAKKQYERCRRNSDDPGLHFLSQDELLSRIAPLVSHLNAEPMEGQVFSGIPQLRITQSLAEHPLFRLPEDQHYLFRRHWRIAPVSRGMIHLSWSGPHGTEHADYFHPSFASREARKMLVYYDQQDPTSAAQIHETPSGEYLCSADFFHRPGMFLDTREHGHEAKRQYRDAVVSRHLHLLPHIPSRQLPPEISARREESRASAPAASIVEPSASDSGSAPESPRRSSQSEGGLSFRTRQILGDPDPATTT